MFKVSTRCFCAFCRSPRVVYRKRHVSLIDVGLAALTSFLLSVIFWQELEPRALVFFAVGLGFAELFIVFRWRLSIACPHCGFDPVLYKRNPDLAGTRVKEFIARRREDPLSAFMPPPRLPFVIKKTGAKPAVQQPRSLDR